MSCLMIAGLYFNPRSHEGSDPSRPYNSKILPADFNPRSHEGSDKAEVPLLTPLANYFNPRSHEGSDTTLIVLLLSSKGFQSTLPRGERHSRTGQSDKSYNFNPRSHEGSDFRETYSGSALTAISIHAPTRGATKPAKKKPVDEDISIHAPTRGATTYTLGITDTYAISIHAPTRGATICE